MSQKPAAGQGASQSKVRGRLKALEKEDEGWVRSERNGQAVLWSKTDKLEKTIPVAERPKTPEQEAYDWTAHHQRNRQRAADRLMADPATYALLQAIRKKGRCGIVDLRVVVPQLDRNATVRHLKRLRDAGWLQVVGTTKNAVWEATEKLYQQLPKRPPRTNEMALRQKR